MPKLMRSNRIKWLILGIVIFCTSGLILASNTTNPLSDTFALQNQSVRMMVSSAGRVSGQIDGSRFTYLSDGSNYMKDGSLILGNSPDSLSWLIYQGSGSEPSLANPFGYLLPLSDLTIDSVSSSTYTTAMGFGTNRDSTIGFKVTYYAPKPSAQYFFARFLIYKGLNDPTGSVNNLTVAFATDWDIPSDVPLFNSAYHDSFRQAIYQRGEYTSPNMNRFGILAALRDDNQPIAGGFVWQNALSVTPFGTFQADSLWSKMHSPRMYDIDQDTADLNSVIVVGRNYTVDGAAHDTLRFTLLIGGMYNGTAGDVETYVSSAFHQLCNTIMHGSMACACACGDANNDHYINISDAVFIIRYIFNGGQAPPRLCQADANGDVFVNISDAVFLISYIFAGGGAPPICSWDGW